MTTDVQLKALYALGDALHAPSPNTPSSGFISRGIPEDLIPLSGFTVLELSGDEARQFRSLAPILRADPLFEHLSQDEVDRELWRLVCEISLQGGLRDPKRRRRQIRDWLQSLRRPWVEYEFIQEIGGFAPDVEGLRFDGAEFHRITPRLLREWELDGRVRWRGRTAFALTISAGSARMATERGARFTALLQDLLRFGLRSTILATIGDDQVAFPPGWSAVRVAGETRWSRISLRRTPVGRDRWGRSDIERAFSSLHAFEVLSKTAHSRIRGRLETAFRWLGTVREFDNAPASYIAATAALEGLLGSREERDKGELLALRSMLLALAIDEGFTDPIEIVWGYGVRSDLVHGEIAELDRAAVRAWYWTVSRLTSQVLVLCEKVPAVRRSRDVFRHIETDEALASAEGWLRRRGKQYSKIAETAQRRRAEGLPTSSAATR